MSEKKSRSTRSRILLVVINVVSLASLFWTLRGSHLCELKDDLLEMNWWWIALAVAADVSVYFWHGLRWQTLLRPVVRLKYWEPVRAIYVGLFANEVLPFRAGEVLRCYLLARNPLLPLSVSLTSALIERIFDGIWLSLCIILMLRYTVIPHSLRYLVDGAYVLGITVLVVALVLGVIMFRRHETRAALAGEKGWRRQLHVLIDDLEIIGHSRLSMASFLQSLPYLLFMIDSHLCDAARFWLRFPLGSRIRADGGVAPGHGGAAGSGKFGFVSSPGGGSPGKDLQRCPRGSGAVFAGAVGDRHAAAVDWRSHLAGGDGRRS